jgi:hypothetical protein
MELHFRQWLELVSPGEPEKEQPNNPTTRGMPTYGGEPLPGNTKPMKKQKKGMKK